MSGIIEAIKAQNKVIGKLKRKKTLKPKKKVREVPYVRYNFKSDAHLHLPKMYMDMINPNLRSYRARNNITAPYKSFKENVLIGLSYFLKHLKYNEYREVSAETLKRVLNTKIYKEVIEYLKHVQIIQVFKSYNGTESYWNGDGAFSKKYKMRGCPPYNNDYVKIYIENYRNIQKIERYELYMSDLVRRMIDLKHNRKESEMESLERKLSKSNQSEIDKVVALANLAAEIENERIRREDEKKAKSTRRYRGYLYSLMRKMDFYINYDYVKKYLSIHDMKIILQNLYRYTVLGVKDAMNATLARLRSYDKNIKLFNGWTEMKFQNMTVTLLGHGSNYEYWEMLGMTPHISSYIPMKFLVTGGKLPKDWKARWVRSESQVTV